MLINLEYNSNWDAIPREQIPNAYYGILSLSCALDVSYNISNHINIINKALSDYPKASNRDIWYITLLCFIKNRAGYKKNYYMSKLISDMLIYYKDKELPTDIDFIVNQLNAILPYEGFFISLNQGITEEDHILNLINKHKEDIYNSCNKYMVFKNTSTDFLSKTIIGNNTKNEYIDEFNVLYDVMIMFLMRAIEEIFMDGAQYDETEIRFRIFEAIEHFSMGVFIKNQSKIADKICSIIAGEKLALKN